jgi:hypothetical protein
MQPRKEMIRMCSILIMLFLAFLAGCTARQDITLPKNLSESMTYKAFLKDTQVDNYTVIKQNIGDVSKKSFTWAHELMASEEKVKDMRFLMYSGFEVGMDGKSDNYWISGYSDSFERVYYLHVEDGIGTAYEVKKPVDYIFSSIDSTSKMKNPADMVSEAVSRGGECPDGVILEFNTSSTKSLIGCPGKWRYLDVTYMRLTGGSSGASIAIED